MAEKKAILCRKQTGWQYSLLDFLSMLISEHVKLSGFE